MGESVVTVNRSSPYFWFEIKEMMASVFSEYLFLRSVYFFHIDPLQLSNTTECLKIARFLYIVPCAFRICFADYLHRKRCFGGEESKSKAKRNFSKHEIDSFHNITLFSVGYTEYFIIGNDWKKS